MDVPSAAVPELSVSASCTEPTELEVLDQLWDELREVFASDDPADELVLLTALECWLLLRQFVVMSEVFKKEPNVFAELLAEFKR